jgi:hypothetical protein
MHDPKITADENTHNLYFLVVLVVLVVLVYFRLARIVQCIVPRIVIGTSLDRSK